MNLELGGKVALVTGSSRGIGLAIAQALAREGCQVALNARHEAGLAAAAVGFENPPLVTLGDRSQPADAARVVNEVLAHHGRLDIIVANVGSGRSVPPGREDHTEWQRVFTLNLWSTTNTVEAARAALAASRGCDDCDVGDADYVGDDGNDDGDGEHHCGYLASKGDAELSGRRVAAAYHDSSGCHARSAGLHNARPAHL
jgi:NAD(P)-dependent dehydrogenase (short-subunit alcohol dehydrogenase family)